MAYPRCKTCKFYDGDKEFQMCSRWRYGYRWDEPLPDNEIQVESDEGWGAVMGPDFGCVLHEAKS